MHLHYATLHTNCHIKNIKLKVDHHAIGKWFTHGPKRRKDNRLQSLEHLRFADGVSSTKRVYKFIGNVLYVKLPVSLVKYDLNH